MALLLSIRELKWLRERKGNVHYVEQLEKLIPFIATIRTFRQDVSELATGVTTFHLDQWVKSDPVEQPVMCHSLGTGYNSHRRAPALSLPLGLQKMYNAALWRETLTFGGT